MQKWQSLGAGPIQVKRFNDAWSKLTWENNTFVELRGVIGQREHSSVLTNLFGSHVREDVTAAKEKIGQQFSWMLTKANAAEAVEAVLAELPALKANRPVKDERETPEQRQVRDEEHKVLEAERIDEERKERETFVNLYGNGQTVTVQPGQMAVTARICYDNSDSMTDYFDSHASLSPRFALLIASKQAQTERLARRAVAPYALLASRDMDWRTETYSMGHGNYLQDKKGFELPPELAGIRRYYRGGEVNHGHWEVEFEQAYSHPIELPAIKGYGAPNAASPQPGSPEYEALRARVAQLEGQKVA